MSLTRDTATVAVREMSVSPHVKAYFSKLGSKMGESKRRDVDYVALSAKGVAAMNAKREKKRLDAIATVAVEKKIEV